jgi:hypothetical protein
MNKQEEDALTRLSSTDTSNMKLPRPQGSVTQHKSGKVGMRIGSQGCYWSHPGSTGTIAKAIFGEIFKEEGDLKDTGMSDPVLHQMKEGGMKAQIWFLVP